jgi:hypothetical protein
VPDVCGVCGGDGRELDCAGICFGNTHNDCMGVCNGTAVLDDCGACAHAAARPQAAQPARPKV